MAGVEGEQVLEYESVRVVDNHGQVDDEGYIWEDAQEPNKIKHEGAHRDV